MTLRRMHLSTVMPTTSGRVQGMLSEEVVEDLPQGLLTGNQTYYLSTAGEWWWWRSSRDEHEQARRLLKVGQIRLRRSWELMAKGEAAESVAAAERAVGYLQSAYDKGGQVDGNWKGELVWSVKQYEQVLEDMRMAAPDDLKGRVARQEHLVELISAQVR